MLALNWLSKLKHYCFNPLLVAGKQKIFCIGSNKTGTTTLFHGLSELGVRMGSQRIGESLIDNWDSEDFGPIIRYCRTAQGFQDVPFSLPGIYRTLYPVFPDASYILSVRDSEAWYDSLVNYHSRLWGDGIKPPTAEQLKRAEYIYKGRPWHVNRMVFNTPEDEPYKKDILIAAFEKHNKDVKEFFRDKPSGFLVLDVSRPGSYSDMCDFLGMKPVRDRFQVLNSRMP